VLERVIDVNRIICCEISADDTSRAATFMITKFFSIALFITSVPVFADTLVVGSVYFDSEQTLKEVINLSAQHDNEGIAKLIQNGHISDKTQEVKDIVVLTSGSTPESPAEFRFLNGPTTYWTLTKNVTNFAQPIPTPTPLPTPTPEPTPLPTESPTPTSEHQNRHRESNAPFGDDNGRRIWHQVHGKWKWYPANNRHAPVKKEISPDEAPSVKP
jgi:hypothetical protein